jgi:hypothetical protein
MSAEETPTRLGLRVVDGLRIRVVERLPEPDPRDRVLNWTVSTGTEASR